jgi:hypothetical protein
MASEGEVTTLHSGWFSSHHDREAASGSATQIPPGFTTPAAIIPSIKARPMRPPPINATVGLGDFG